MRRRSRDEAAGAIAVGVAVGVALLATGAACEKPPPPPRPPVATPPPARPPAKREPDELPDHPSTLAVLWPRGEDPAAELVHERLRAIAPTLQPVETVETEEAAAAAGVAVDRVVFARRYPRSGDAPMEVIAIRRERDDGLIAALAGSDRPIEVDVSPRLGQPGLEAVGRAGYAIVVRTRLDAEHPLASYRYQLRLATAVAGEESPAIFDAGAHRLIPPTEAHELTITSSVVPPIERLFSVHVVAREDERWVHTHGLNRIGLPELDLVDVPASLADEAARTLLTCVASLLCDYDPPPGYPTAPIALAGPELRASLVWWKEAVERMPEGVVGGADDRPDAPHRGWRMLLVALDREARPRPWQPPVRVLEHIASGGGIRISRREIDRRAALARERWPDAATLFARHGGQAGWRFVVKAAFTVDGGLPENREHLWFVAKSLDADGFAGSLITEPQAIARFHAGDEGAHPTSIVTDWSILAPSGSYGPADAGLLLAGSND